MRWTVGLSIGFAVVLAMNVLLVWLSLGAAAGDPVVESYRTEAR